MFPYSIVTGQHLQLPMSFLDSSKHVSSFSEDSFFFILIQESLASVELSQLWEGCHCTHTSTYRPLINKEPSQQNEHFLQQNLDLAREVSISTVEIVPVKQSKKLKTHFQHLESLIGDNIE